MPTQDPYGEHVVRRTGPLISDPSPALAAAIQADEDDAEVRTAVETVKKKLRSGRSVKIHFTGVGRYSMKAKPFREDATVLSRGATFVTLAPGLIETLPDYDFNQLAPRAFWKMCAQLIKRDTNGVYIDFEEPRAEVTMSQGDLAKLLKTSRQRVNEAMGQLMDRNFVWPITGRSKYQIHPELFYFGSSDNQAEAIFHAINALQVLENKRAKKENRDPMEIEELPDLPLPGTPILKTTVVKGPDGEEITTMSTVLA